MFDDIAAYYHENVVTAFTNYRKTSTDGIAGKSRDLRAALSAASALFHLREHLPTRLTRTNIEKLCPDYALLGDVVNASKHKSINNQTPHGPPYIDNATQLEELIAITEYEDNQGNYKYAQKFVIVKLHDGTERYMHDVLTNVINFWEQYLQKAGIVQKARVFEHKNDICFRTRTECNENKLDFEIIKGVRFHQTIRLLRFDSKTQTVEIMEYIP